ncbi:hypothetical protein IWW39_000170 [Coemansia spiralis]|uniref:polynucleotide adenylyltransferase n=1 Tax=Coemansia spiralis TaxID=417178 RepID=A0A9W8GQP3_9FUNG|nr:hypothetical protein IWW39_000170 [Coemansia spiralis]
MERAHSAVVSISPPTTRNSSAQSSPSAPRSAQLPSQQQQPKHYGKPRWTKHASSSSVGTASDAASGRAVQTAPVDGSAATCSRGGNKQHGNSGGRASAKHTRPSSSEQGKDTEAGGRSSPHKQRKQQGYRDQAHYQQNQQQAARQRSNKRQGQNRSATMSPNTARSNATLPSTYGQGKGHSKQPSARSTDDDAGSAGYGAHGDETEDSDDEYAIGFCPEEWEAHVLGHTVQPTGLEQSLTAQILHTYETRLFPSAESIEVKRAFIEKFATILTIEFPNWEIDIHVFGSSVNGLGTSRSDVDICLTTGHKELENVFVLSKVLRKYGMRTYCVPHARVPIVKAWDSELRIASDINVNNTIALHNTRMIQTFVAIDARVRPFVMAIKHWSKCRELNDAAFGGTLSPYAWVNLAINFLQTRQPPILPVIHPPVSSLSAKDCMHGSELNLTFNDDIDQLRGFGLANAESLGYLLYSFFRTYAFEFDYRHQVVSLRHGCFLTKEQKGWDTGRPSRIFCIEEPFSTWLNLGHSANTTSVEGIRQEFQRAFIILRDGGSYDEACEAYQRPPRDPSSTTPDLLAIQEADLDFGTGPESVYRDTGEALGQPISPNESGNQPRHRNQRRQPSCRLAGEATACSPSVSAFPIPAGAQRLGSHGGEAIPGLLSGYDEAAANVCGGHYMPSTQDIDEHRHSYELLSSKLAKVSVCSPDEVNR